MKLNVHDNFFKSVDRPDQPGGMIRRAIRRYLSSSESRLLRKT
jgi:hypothetical protein